MTKDITGQQFGRLTVLHHAYDAPHKKHPNKIVSYWECQCECGSTYYAAYESLAYGTRRSCGCLRKELMHKLVEQAFEEEKYFQVWLNNKKVN